MIFIIYQIEHTNIPSFDRRTTVERNVFCVQNVIVCQNKAEYDGRVSGCECFLQLIYFSNHAFCRFILSFRVLFPTIALFMHRHS